MPHACVIQFLNNVLFGFRDVEFHVVKLSLRSQKEIFIFSPSRFQSLMFDLVKVQFQSCYWSQRTIKSINTQVLELR